MSEYWRFSYTSDIFTPILFCFEKKHTHTLHTYPSHTHIHPHIPMPLLHTSLHTHIPSSQTSHNTLTPLHIHSSYTPPHTFTSLTHPHILSSHTFLQSSHPTQLSQPPYLSSPTFLCTFIPQSVQINHSHAYPHSSSPISQCTTHYHFLTYLNFNLFFKVHWSPIFFIKLSRPPCLWFFFPRFLTQLVVLLVSRATALKYKLYCNIYCRFIENSLFN